MATTKLQIAEQILRLINSGDVTSDNDIDIREIILAVEQERDRLVRLRLFESLQMGEMIVAGDVISSFDNVLIKKDSVKDMLYSDLPGNPLSLPNDYGVWQVSYQKNQKSSFIRMPNGSMGLYNGLPSSALGGRDGFFVEGNKIYYNDSVSDCCGNTILLKMVLNSGSIANNITFPIPADIQSEVIKNITQLFSLQKQFPHDEQNDNIE
jgi:hypothetical protein|tara:strand:+ start:435 stop:1061 length:627 start_codon:yes stop_codon:yes gene_type:complete